MEELRFQIADEMEDERIDKCMSLLVENLSRSFIQKLIKDGNVLVNGKPVKGSYRVKCDDEVRCGFHVHALVPTDQCK